MFYRLRHESDVLRVNQAKTTGGLHIHPTVFIHEAFFKLNQFACIGTNHALGVDAPHVGRGLQFNVDALWSILEEARALRVGAIVALDEFDQLRVLQLGAFRAGQTTGKRTACLRAIVTHVPVAARIQPEPAIAVRHVGPLGHGLANKVVHR
jgi:hypothetical protein